MAQPSRQFVFLAPRGILGREERGGPSAMIGVTASAFVTDLSEVVAEDRVAIKIQWPVRSQYRLGHRRGISLLPRR